MTEQKEDMIVLCALSALGGAMVLIGLYCANYLAFECIRVRGESVLELMEYFSIFLALIGMSGVLITSITRMYISVCVKNSRKMFAGMGDVLGFLAVFMASFMLMHLLNIFGGWANFGMGVLSGGRVLAASVLLSTIVCLLSFIYGKLSKKGRKR